MCYGRYRLCNKHSCQSGNWTLVRVWSQFSAAPCGMIDRNARALRKAGRFATTQLESSTKMPRSRGHREGHRAPLLPYVTHWKLPAGVRVADVSENTDHDPRIPPSQRCLGLQSCLSNMTATSYLWAPNVTFYKTLLQLHVKYPGAMVANGCHTGQCR